MVVGGVLTVRLVALLRVGAVIMRMRMRLSALVLALCSLHKVLVVVHDAADSDAFAVQDGEDVGDVDSRPLTSHHPVTNVATGNEESSDELETMLQSLRFTL